MNTVTEMEGINTLRSLAKSTVAEDVLKKTEWSPSLLIVLFSAACSGGTFALLAARPEPMFAAIVGSVAGAALSLSAFSLGESRRLRRRLEAVLALNRSEA